jgi:serine/threonine protein kinase
MIGQTISHYIILEKLGEGGMGVVYKAEDTRLDRIVALKFLPAQVAASDQDKARFIQEAKAAAALNHPNVCSIIDIQEHDGPQGGKQMFMVMEFVDGQTLREKIGTLSQKQAIDIGIQVADGLSAAHEKGIVHRDIKPENIMVRKDGICQIMDFGLAKLRTASSKINRLTREGSTVGTAGYMSPEQVQGQDVDHRSDIFSLGVVLYEAFTGQLPFKGVHETALAYEIVNVDPAPMSSIKPDIDPGLDAILLDCLEKDPKERCQSVAEVARDLRRVKRESTRQRASRITAARPAYSNSGIRLPEVPVAQAEQSSGVSRILPWIVTGVFILVSGYVAFVHFREPALDSPVLRSYIHPPDNITFQSQSGGHIALSPDGRTLAFAGRDSVGRINLWVRPLRSLTAQQLPGTEDASYPFWSPDNKQIAFFSNGKMKRIDATGGPALTICDAPNGRGGSWSAAGLILFAPDNTTGLSKVSAAGGMPVVVTRPDAVRGEDNHRFPMFLPDGNRFLYITQSVGAGGASEKDELIAGSLSDSSYRNELLHISSNMQLSRGHLLYYQQKTLMARPFDPDKIQFTGDAVPIAEDVLYGSARSKASFSASETGVLLYQGGFTTRNRLVMVDRTGREVQSLAEGASLASAKLSPDGKTIVYAQEDPQVGTQDLWLYEIARQIRTRFTFDPVSENTPNWSPDGTNIVYSSARGARVALYEKSTATSDSARLLYSSSFNNFASSWSADGKYLLFYSTGDAKTKVDLHVFPFSGERTPVDFLKTEFVEVLGQFSPDQRWVAYQSNASGQFEIYIRPFPNSGAQWQVSKSGGNSPVWARDGKELYFASANRKLMSVAIKAAANRVEIGEEHELFDLDSRGPAQMSDVTADGGKFLISVSPAGLVQPVTMVTNWDAEVRNK